MNPLPFTDEAKGILAQSGREALQLGYNRVGPEHLLLAIARSDTLAAEAISRLGAELPDVRRAVIGLLDGARRSR